MSPLAFMIESASSALVLSEDLLLRASDRTSSTPGLCSMTISWSERAASSQSSREQLASIGSFVFPVWRAYEEAELSVNMVTQPL